MSKRLSNTLILFLDYDVSVAGSRLLLGHMWIPQLAAL
jgi:hypothetical protein